MDFCDSTELRKLYTTPLGTRRGLEVFICEKCDLVQSFPKIDHVEDITKRVSWLVANQVLTGVM